MSQPARKQEPRRRATYADLVAVPEHLVAELIDGELIVSPRPATPHAFASSSMGADLFVRFGRGGGGDEAPGGWWILDEPELSLGGDALIPDLGGWRRERVPVFPNVPRFELAPDWVCEVVSPSTARTDRMKKMAVYARERVGHVWLVDPLAQTLEVFRLEGGRWVVVEVYGGDMAVRAEPFEAVGIELKHWWPPEPAPAGAAGAAAGETGAAAPLPTPEGEAASPAPAGEAPIGG
jgi:Uma2 family endonuclease